VCGGFVGPYPSRVTTGVQPAERNNILSSSMSFVPTPVASADTRDVACATRIQPRGTSYFPTRRYAVADTG
jgi:hypothetical protein